MILRAMLGAARQWDDLAAHVPDACANIAKNPRRPVARFLDREELQRLGAALDRHRGEHPWSVAALRLLTLTGARLRLAQDGASARLARPGRGAADRPGSRRCDRPEGARVFPEDLTPARLYTFWRAIREEAGLPGLRIHDARHTWASQGVMNGVGLTTVGRLLGHSKRRTTAIYAHLDDAALQGAAAQAAAVIAGAMGYKAAPPPLPDGADGSEGGETPDTPAAGDAGAVRPGGTEAGANPGGKAPRRRLPGLIPI